MRVTMFSLNRCDACCKARRWLERFGIEYHFVDLCEQHPKAQRWLDWARQAGGWEVLVNKASTTWRNLLPQRKSPSPDAEWILLLREYPALARRPLLVLEDGHLPQCFSDNRYKKLFADKLAGTSNKRHERAECPELQNAQQNLSR